MVTPVDYQWVKGFPPSTCTSDEDSLAEAYLDIEWSGATAPGAHILYMAGSDVEDSANTIVNYSRPAIISTSFGSCEASIGSYWNNWWNTLWQQAAAQGITAVVSYGDSGAAMCDLPTQESATRGQAVDAIASSPYNVAVGGAQFDDIANPGLYWSQAGAALSYIPEAAWNESGSNGLWSTGGGYSGCIPNPPGKLEIALLIAASRMSRCQPQATTGT
jgi:subtilase family serine protease